MTNNQAQPTELLPERIWVADNLEHVHLQPQANCPCNAVEYTRVQSPAQAEWLPMDSAPKDGEDVLLWIPVEEGFDIAYWRDDTKDWDTYDGWLQNKPSHWMRPLPPKGAS